MDVTSIVPAIICLTLALGVSFGLMKYVDAPLESGRNASIDGLRGYLAFFVFLHHSCLWYFYIHTGDWGTRSVIYTQFGSGTVKLFFMITGFLFFSKLLRIDTHPINWLHMLISRIMRLGPLYVFALCALFLVVALVSHDGLIDTPIQTAKNVLKWASFSIMGTPDLNGVTQTWRILAGVTWTLPYEWAFYFSLPLLAVMIGRIPSVWVVLASIAGLFAIGLIWTPGFGGSLPFLSGIAAAYLARSGRFKAFATTTVASVIVATALISVAVSVTLSANGKSIFLLTLAFVLIASGNDLFGILTSKISRFFGEQTYSMYLIHGLVLYVTFHFVIGVEQSRLLTPFQHWLVIAGLSPVLILICRGTFTWIEAPSMLVAQNFIANLKPFETKLPTTEVDKIDVMQ